MKKTNSLKYMFASIKFSMSMFFKADTKLTIGSIIIFLILSLIPSLALFLQKNIFENLLKDSVNIYTILYFFIALKIFDIISVVINYINKLITMKIEFKIKISFSKIIHKKLFSIEMDNFDKPDVSDLLSRVNNLLPTQISNSVILVINIVTFIIQIISCSLILLSINIILPFMFILSTIPYLFLYQKLNFNNYFMKVGQSKEFRKNWYLLKMLFTKHYNKEMKFNHLFNYLGETEKNINSKLHNESYSLVKKYSGYRIFLEIIKNSVKGICILFVALLIKSGLNISALSVLIQSSESIQNSLLNLFNSFKEINSATLYFKDYLEFLNLVDENYTNQVKIKQSKTKPFIQYKNVSVKYFNSENLALNDVSFTINEGEKVAIVGENGSGKTTLVNVLLGFYDYNNGSINIYDNTLKNSYADLRENTVYVRQITNKYLFSIEENIYMGNNINSNKYDLFNGILNIDEIISKFPDKEKTLLGVSTDTNYDISGGEWAKLGVLRNCLKNNPMLYIFDEPTAALDPIVESDIYTSFKNLTENKTSIFISHRLGISKIVDKIIVMDKGKIAEIGTHNSLLELKGIYYDMYTKQKQLYMVEL